MAVLRTKIHNVEGVGKCKFTVEGGLRYIKGNSAPYFFLTYSETGKGHDCGGAGHTEIIAQYPELSDLAALHLSDIDGAPMYAAGNGFYWLEGACGGLGYKYHGGSGSDGKTEVECLDILARHLRVPLVDAMRIRDDTLARMKELTRTRSQQYARPYVQADFEETCERMRGRWKIEADECVERHGLVLCGDKWTPTEAPTTPL